MLLPLAPILAAARMSISRKKNREEDSRRPARESSDADDALQTELVSDEEIAGDAARFEEDVEVTPDLPVVRSARSSVVSHDPLQQYMREVQRYSLLSPEETNELAVKYVTTGDVDAARKLVTANLRLVVKIAFDYKRAHRNILDLIQEGNIGLMQAVSKYDPYRGVKLSSYAAWWIRAYILRFVLNNWRLVKLGTTQAQRKLFFNLNKEKARLSAMGIEPSPAVIAERLGVTEDDVIQMDRRLSGGDVSLDAPVTSDGNSTSRLELFPGDNQPIDTALDEHNTHAVLSDKIHEFGRKLTGKDSTIFYERLVSDDPKTLQELGEQFGVSRERIRQIEKRLQNKIRAYLEANVDKDMLPESAIDVAEAIDS